MCDKQIIHFLLEFIFVLAKRMNEYKYAIPKFTGQTKCYVCPATYPVYQLFREISFPKAENCYKTSLFFSILVSAQHELDI